MPTHTPIQFATLRSDDGAEVALGWKPRDARQRLGREVDWGNDPWLRVHGRVRCAEGEWSFADPALIEHEARVLADFLDLRPWPTPRTLEFTEPCLTFTAQNEQNGVFILDIRFRAEAAPDWLRDDDHAYWHVGFTLTLCVKDVDLRAFTKQLREMLGFTS